MPLAIHVLSVYGNMCSKVDVNTWYAFREMAMVTVFAQSTKSKKGHNLISSS